MIHQNSPFKCEHCQTENPPASQTCRNHCLNCLWSKHVDENLPGDRASKCQSLMFPFKIDYNNKKGHLIIHQCLKCLKQIPNKLAPDDNLETFTNLIFSINSLSPPK